MSLSNTLKFVRGAVSNKTPALEMRHYIIDNGHIRATNGVLSLGSPIDLDLSCAPNADAMYRAIGNCRATVSAALTPTGRLSIKSGKFRALIDCVDMSGAPHPKPSGQAVDVDGELLLKAFETLERFVSKDTLRPWTNGILLRGQSAFATNNVCLVEYWIGVSLPFVANIPLPAVKEILRINVAPDRVLMDANSITFMYENGRWIKTQLYSTEWPSLDNIFNQPSEQRPVPEDLFAGVKALMSSAPGDRRVYFRDGSLHTDPHSDVGSSYVVDGLPTSGVYRPEMLALLEGVATTIDLDRYPDHALFFGDNIRGAIIGMNE